MMEKWTTRMKNEFIKLRDMTFREKREYIWEYYKVSIIVTLFVLAMVGSLINSWFINPPKKEYLYIAWMGGYVTDDQLNALTAKLTESLVEDPEREEVIISTFFLTQDASYNMAVYNRLAAIVAAGQVDLFVLDEAGLAEMAGTGYIKPLDELMSELTRLGDTSLVSRLTPLLKEAVYQPDDETVPESHLFGLLLQDCPLLASMDIYTTELYLGIVVNTQKTDIIARALQFFYE